MTYYPPKELGTPYRSDWRHGGSCLAKISVITTVAWFTTLFRVFRAIGLQRDDNRPGTEGAGVAFSLSAHAVKKWFSAHEMYDVRPAEVSLRTQRVPLRYALNPNTLKPLESLSTL